MKAFFAISGFTFYLLFGFGMIGCMTPDEKGSPLVKDTKSEPVTVRKTDTVEISAMKFVPDVITVTPGTTIVFINKDMVSHDVTEEASNAWSSKPIAPTEAWHLVADKPVNYYCSIHAVMKGRIIVSR